MHYCLKEFCKQSPGVVLEKGALKNLTKFIEKHLRRSLFFDRVTNWKLVTLLKKRLWHRNLPVRFALKSFKKTYFLWNIYKLVQLSMSILSFSSLVSIQFFESISHQKDILLTHLLWKTRWRNQYPKYDIFSWNVNANSFFNRFFV